MHSVTLDIGFWPELLYKVTMAKRIRDYQRSHARKAAFFSMLIVLLCLFVPSLLQAAITLQTPSTDVLIVVEPIAFNGSDGSLLVPICDLTLVAKHPGFGRVFIEHTPLLYQTEVVMYQLVSERGFDFERSEPFLYRVQGQLHEEVPIGRLWARLVRPLSSTKTLYSSTLRVNLVLEK